MGHPHLKKNGKPTKKFTVGKQIFLSGIILSFLIILIFGFMFLYQLYESEMNRARSSVMKSNQTIKVFIESYFREIANTINALSDNPDVRNVFVLPDDAMERVLDQYRAIAKANRNIVFIYSGYDNGELVINDYTPPEDYNPVSRPWYQAALESSPDISVGVPYQEIKSREWLISTSKLLLPDFRGTRGVLTIDCSIEEIAELLKRTHEFESEYSFVISADGQVLIHHDTDQIGRKFQEFAGLIVSAAEGEFLFKENDINFMAFFRSIELTGWYLITVFESKEIIHPIIVKMLGNLALIIILAVLLGSAQSYFLGKRLAEPMVELTRTMHRIVRGEEDAPGQYKFPDNEIGFMAESVGQLAKQEIRRKNRELEIIIESTTDGILVVDNSGRIIRTNSNFNRLWGNFLVETGNTDFQKLVDQFLSMLEQPSLVIPLFEDIRKNDRICTTELRLKDDRTFEVYSGPFIENDQIIGRLWSFHDITQRKRSEDTLRESEARYRNLLEVSPIGIAVYFEGKVVYVNPAGAQLLGADSMEQIINIPVSEIIHPERLFESQHRLQRMLAGEKGLYPAENVYLKLDGTPIDVEVMATVMPYEGKSAVQVIVKDITQRKRAEEDLKLNERRMATLLELSQMGEYPENALTDFALERAVEITSSRIGYLAFVNHDEAELTMYSWSNGAMAECKTKETPKIYQVAKTGLWGEAIRQRKAIITNDYNVPNPLKKGYPEGHVPIFRHMNLPIVDDGKIVLVAGVGNKKHLYDEDDVQQLNLLMDGLWKTIRTKRVEKALRESEERFSRAFRSSPAPLVISEIDSGFIIDINDRWVELLGYSRQEQIGRTSKEVGIWAEPSERDRIIEKLKKEGFFKNESIEFKNKSGDSIQALWSAEVVTLAGRPVMLSMIYDETERKKAEKERENLQIQLLQAQKMESVGRLAGGVAHDFNNMLGVILGHTELALEQVEPGMPIFSDLKEIQMAAERSADLTRQLLGFARKQTVVPKLLDLNETVEGMLKMLRRLIGENVDLVWLPGAKLWPVKIDPSQVDQVLVNLCVNARDAVSKVGTITIKTENSTFNEPYYADVDRFVSGDFVMIAVSDNGCGMDKETLGKLFEPFFTTKGLGKGTGLGLATVYGIVRQNNGFIYVDSEPDHGTIFRIYLPSYAANPETIARDEPEAPVAHVHGTILLVEDEPAILKLTTLMLKQEGYNVLAALTPGESIQMAELHSGEIHLLITDVIMPEMNGMELAQKLMSMYPQIRCMFMSGYTDDSISRHGVLDDGLHFIRKPFSKKDLAAKVREALTSQ